MEEKKIKGKMKSVASIPANYVSILELQERWLKEKERKHKGKELLFKRGVKEQIDGERRGEEGVMMKVVEAMEPSEKLKEKECVEKEVSTTRIVSNKEENGGGLSETKKEDSIAKETQFFQDRWTKKRVEEVNNGAARLNSGKGYYRNQNHDLSSRRVIGETGAMVWVKKGNNDEV